jgi:hypothetical protein
MPEWDGATSNCPTPGADSDAFRTGPGLIDLLLIGIANPKKQEQQWQ